MGVLNATPDSFFGPSTVAKVDDAVARAVQMMADGAHLVDVGGESSRPGSDPVLESEERARVLPIVEGLVHRHVPVSIDTYHASTADACLSAGALMVNDITGLRGDEAMAGTVAAHKAWCVIMHMQGTPKTMQRAPEYDDVMDTLCAFFEERIAFATAAGIAEDRIWLDPGFGFGKTVRHNLTILRRLSELKRFGRPILLGTSNKSTIGTVLDLPVEQRTEGTAATMAIGIAHGADAVRVHDVKAMARVARMSDAVMGKTTHD